MVAYGKCKRGLTPTKCFHLETSEVTAVCESPEPTSLLLKERSGASTSGTVQRSRFDNKTGQNYQKTLQNVIKTHLIVREMCQL